MPETVFKECPACAEKINVGAAYCKHCKTLLGKAAPSAPARETSVSLARRKTGSAGEAIIKGPSIKKGEPGPFGDDGTAGKMTSLPERIEAEAGSDINRMEVKLNELYNIVNQVNREIVQSKSLSNSRPEPLLERDKVKEIIRYFTNAYSERMESSVKNGFSEREYEIEEKKLQASIGEGAWSKLDSSSKTLLTSARIMYNDLLALDREADFTGVCLLLIKALEREMFKRFYTQFIKFLEKTYPGKDRIKLWPTALLNKYDRKKQTRKYTLIGVTYVLCYASSSSNTAEQNENNRRKLLEYARKKLFLKGPGDDEIERSLAECAEQVEQFCNDYRNPAAQTNQLDPIGAEDCHSLLLDVEKFLKTTLESFAF